MAEWGAAMISGVLGVAAMPEADNLADELRTHIRTWDTHHRHHTPHITAHPTTARRPANTDRTITKRHTHVALN